MAKKNVASSSDKKKKRVSSAKKSGAAAKKSRVAPKSGATPKKSGAAPKKSGRRAATRGAPGPTISLETLVTRRSLIEKSKSPLTYLLDKTEPANSGEIWLCWPDGCILIDDIVDTPQYIVSIEKSKAGP